MAARILVTGSNGFIGMNLAQRLLSEGHRVSSLIRPGSNLERLQGLGAQIKILEADILDCQALREVVQRTEPEVVYHLASTPFNPPTISASTHMQVIAMGTMNLLESLRDRPEVRIICMGSGAEYGSGSSLKEESPLQPATILGAAKAAAALLIQTYARLYGMETVLLRLFTPYGPWEQPGRLIPHTILSALNGRDVRISSGTQQRDYVYIDDVIEALVLAANQPVLPGVAFNICSGRGLPIRQVVEQIMNLMGNPVRVLVGALPTRADEIWEFSGDNSWACKGLGWETVTELEEGLRRSIDWFTRNRKLVELLT